ncbi:MAG TPA: class I SAM-dependent methyltransferase [Drouetiella sp.]
MTNDNSTANASQSALNELLSSETYQSNLQFWNNAWNGVKSAYTQLPDLGYLPSIPEWLTENQYGNILDLGCGSGWLSIYLAKRGFKVTGIDVAPHAIELARNWATSEGLAITFDVEDIAAMSYTPNQFDAVVANSIFEHFTYDLAKCTLERLRSIIKPQGGFIGCFDKVGTGPGDYFKLDDGSQIYTDKFRKGMLLRFFPDAELQTLFSDWKTVEVKEVDSGSRLVTARA